jgi:hypothetical protein
MELPYVFRSTIATIPAVVPYVHVPAATIATERPNVGIVWRGGDWDPRRSIPFATLDGLLNLPGISWWSLQYDRRPHERHANVQCLDPTSLDHVASAMQSLDLIITIDSVSAHLAGALGIPVWTLLPSPADWRWLIERDDSPWYPSMRLFRQRRPGEWAAVIDAVAGALRMQSPWRR